MNYLLIIILTIFIILLLAFGYYGGLTKITVDIKKQGGETVVYQKINGDYKQSGVIMDKIYNSLLENDSIQTYKGFGKYYDNPKKIDKNKLRSEAGCIIEETDLHKIDRISGDFNTMVIPQTEYITAEYPYKNKLSILFSLLRVYPALNKFAEDNGFYEDSPVMEIYDIPNNRISYRKEIKSR